MRVRLDLLTQAVDVRFQRVRRDVGIVAPYLAQQFLTPDRLAAAITRLLSSPQVLESAAASAKGQGRPDAVVRLADMVEELVGRGEKSA